MNNLSKEKKQQLLLVAFITLIIVGIIWVGLISAQNASLDALEKKAAEMRRKVDTAQKISKQAPLLLEQLGEAKSELQVREETMANGDLFQWFLSRMIQSTSSRPLNNFNALPPTLVDTKLIPRFPYRSASYPVKINGHYHDFGKFLADIENEFPYARIQNLDISPAPGQTDERLNFSFEFVTLYHTNRAVTVR